MSKMLWRRLERFNLFNASPSFHLSNFVSRLPPLPPTAPPILVPQPHIGFGGIFFFLLDSARDILPGGGRGRRGPRPEAGKMSLWITFTSYVHFQMYSKERRLCWKQKEVQQLKIREDSKKRIEEDGKKGGKRSHMGEPLQTYPPPFARGGVGSQQSLIKSVQEPRRSRPDPSSCGRGV